MFSSWPLASPLGTLNATHEMGAVRKGARVDGDKGRWFFVDGSVVKSSFASNRIIVTLPQVKTLLYRNVEPPSPALC